MTPRTRAAFHEAGHAAAAFIFRRPIYRIRINDGGSSFVSCSELAPAARDLFPYSVWRELARQEIAITLAGPIAERLCSGKSDPRAWRGDLATATQWKQALNVSAGTPLPVSAVQRMLSEVRTWRAVRELAQCLAETRHMSGCDASAVCSFHGVPRIRPSASLDSADARAGRLPGVSIREGLRGASYVVSL
jgi:hypothetical protein